MKGENLREEFRKASRRFERKHKPVQRVGTYELKTYEVIREMIRREVLSLETSRAIVRRSGVLSAMGDYFQHKNRAGADLH